MEKNNNTTSENMKQIVILSRYTWEDRMTSMQCAWGYSYTFIDITNPDEWKICIKRCTAGCGQDLEDVIGKFENHKVTDEYRDWYNKETKRQHDESIRIQAKKMYEECTKELEKYNASKRVQKKGQIVVVHGGRKHDGRIGRVMWIGKNSFKPNYSSRYSTWQQAALGGICGMKPYTIPEKDSDLVLIRPLTPTAWADGLEKAYIDLKRCEVIEGFEPINITMQDCIDTCERRSGGWKAFTMADTYDYVEY